MDGKNELWQRFLEKRSIELRDELIISYAPLIKYFLQD